MSILKDINRKILGPLLLNLNGDRILRSLSSNTIVNIMYHGVTRENSNYFSPRHISLDQFEKQMRYLSKEFDIISIPQAFDYLRNNYKLKRKTVTVSFDDGYRNNLLYALPVLEKYGIKATFFISGICTEEMKIRALWTDIVGCLKYFHKNEVIRLENKEFRNFADVESGISLGDYLSTCDISTQTLYLKNLISEFNIEKEINALSDDLWKILDRDELKQLSSSVIADIGSHGYSHYKLAEIDIADAKRELLVSKESLQSVIDKEVTSVAYPFGNYNGNIKDLAEKLGYNYQMAVDFLGKDDAGDLRILNRHGIPSTTTYEANILLLNGAFISKGYN